MCWTGDIKHKRIATEDICCKKIISTSEDKMLRAWFRRNHVYHIGETYTARINPLPSTVGETRLIIRNGLHCYDNKVGITSVNLNNGEPPYLVVSTLSWAERLLSSFLRKNGSCRSETNHRGVHHPKRHCLL